MPQDNPRQPQTPPPEHPPVDAAPAAEDRTSLWRKIRTFIGIMNVRLRFIALMVVVGLVAANWEKLTNYYDRWTRPPQVLSAVESQAVEYYCPMHPHIIREQPGKCPICGMPLVKRAKTAGQAALPEGVLAQVQLTPLKVERGRIGTSPVEYRLLSREVRTVGIVDYDETRRAYISSRIKGRVDKLLVNYIGQKVKKGDPLAEIYSPDLVVAQEELLTAARALKEQKSPESPAALSARAVVDASRRKLLLWGVTDQQVEEILRRGTPQTHVAVLSPIAGIVTEKKVLEGHYAMEGEDLYTVADLGRVWLQAKVFERDIQGINEGTVVEVTTTAYPNEVFAGKITFIAYTVDPQTRTIAARVEVDNPEYKLRPGMAASATARLPLGKVTPAEPGATTAPAAAETPRTPVATDSFAHAYLALAKAYAEDKTDPAALDAMVKEAEKLAQATPAAATLGQQAQQLQGKNLDGQREAFKALSEAAIALLRQFPAKHPLYIAHCPMAKADWITASQEILNPYQGSDMLTCGGITGPLEAEPAGGARETERYALGYYCPVYPDRLYEKPEECPLDKFPTQYAKVEKVLAVPESAVIDTGNRKVVYRETLPGSGTFDMLEVKLGPRAGEFYPVVAGLAAGDRVATQGAFLVDAENRLNPGAAAQYFGASGGPVDASGGKHQH